MEIFTVSHILSKQLLYWRCAGGVSLHKFLNNPNYHACHNSLILFDIALLQPWIRPRLPLPRRLNRTYLHAFQQWSSAWTAPISKLSSIGGPVSALQRGAGLALARFARV